MYHNYDLKHNFERGRYPKVIDRGKNDKSLKMVTGDNEELK